jgi:hypothetical protein
MVDRPSVPVAPAALSKHKELCGLLLVRSRALLPAISVKRVWRPTSYSVLLSWVLWMAYIHVHASAMGRCKAATRPGAEYWMRRTTGFVYLHVWSSMDAERRGE